MKIWAGESSTIKIFAIDVGPCHADGLDLELCTNSVQKSSIREILSKILLEIDHGTTQRIALHQYVEGVSEIGQADLVIDDCFIVELKSTERLQPVHGKQLLTYLKLSGARLGLLVNFGQEFVKDGIKRVAN